MKLENKKGTLPQIIKMMKRILTSLILIGVFYFANAQESYKDYMKSVGENKNDNEVHGFDITRVFTGGGLSLGYGTNESGDGTTNSTFNIGAIPEIGYSFSDLIDAGIASNINYTSTNYSAYAAKQKITNYSIGAFARIFPMDNFFIQIMPEQDWGNYKLISSGYTQITKIKSNSFLAGIGFESKSFFDLSGLGKRIIGESYFYTLIMVDLGKDKYSPYNSYNPYTNQVTVLPIVRGGFNFYPFRKKQK